MLWRVSIALHWLMSKKILTLLTGRNGKKPHKVYGVSQTWYGSSEATRHMRSTRDGMYEHKLCKGVNARIVSYQKLHLRLKKETPTGLIFDRELHVLNLK